MATPAHESGEAVRAADVALMAAVSAGDDAQAGSMHLHYSTSRGQRRRCAANLADMQPERQRRGVNTPGALRRCMLRWRLARMRLSRNPPTAAAP